MNILLLNHYAGSPEMGMEFRPYYLATEWLKMGYNVKIVSGDFSHLRTKNPKVDKDFQETVIDGINYCWLRTGTYEGNGVKRALTMFRYVGKLWINAQRFISDQKPDVVIASSTYPLDTYAAQKIAKKAEAILIHEVHDMWPATLYEMGGMSKKNPFVMVMQIAEKSAYKNSNRVVSLLPYAKEYMVKYGMNPEKFIHISNGVIEEEWTDFIELPSEHKLFFERMKGSGRFIVGYFGGHALSNALDILLDVAKKTTDPNIAFVLVGNGVEKKRLKRRKKEESINNLFFLPPVSKKAIPDLVRYIDCIYIGSQNSPLYRFGICMNKIFDSMMSGKPIVASITTPSSPISQYNCGIMVRSGDCDGIVQAIQTIKNMDTETRRVFGANGKTAVMQNFTYKKLAAQFAALFKEKAK